MALYDDDQEIRREFLGLWNDVFTLSNKVLRDAEIYGFELMDLPDPNIHQIARVLRMLEVALSLSVAHGDSGDGYTDMRRALNAKQQVYHVEMAALALEQDDRVAYEAAIASLRKQNDF